LIGVILIAALLMSRRKKSQSNTPGNLFCSKCGKPVQPGNEFCTGCGTKINR
jgi:predicted amidophosphoribosyltransferase